MEAPHPFAALREALLAAASAGRSHEPLEPADAAPLVAGSPGSPGPPDEEWGEGAAPFQAAAEKACATAPEAECEPSGAASLLSLSGPAPMATFTLCRMLPPRPPRRKIIVPSHRIPQSQRQLPPGGLLTVAPRPAPPAGGDTPAEALEAGRAPVMLEPGRAMRIETPGALVFGAPAPVQSAMPLPVKPFPMPVAQAPGRDAAGPLAAGEAGPLPRLAGAVPPRSRLSPRGAWNFTPLPVSKLPRPTGKGAPLVDLAPLMNGALQPFRLHRLPPRPFAWRPEPAPVRRLPAKLGPIPSPAPAGVLFVPRAAMMPIRPAYALGPPPGQAWAGAGTPAQPSGQAGLPAVNPGLPRKG